ncbi:hypothetical protein [Hydrogenophaga sp. T2]|uniref:hypothetical protein n=1 Tax=Hydrogenophaga sp. T2 TaxID=3132823 RepID=UPI003CF7EBB3
MSAEVTIAESRHNLARDANHETSAIVELLRSKLTGDDVGTDDLRLIRGLVLRLHVLNDVMFDTVIESEKIDEAAIARKLGLTV